MKKLIVTICVFTVSQVWAVNKCTSPDGSVSFQDGPCTAIGRSEVVKLPYVAPTSERDTQAGAAIAAGQVRTGMTSAEVRRSWGNPSKINTTIGSYGKHEQWVYDRPNYRNQYLYIQNGVLTGVQTPE